MPPSLYAGILSTVRTSPRQDSDKASPTFPAHVITSDIDENIMLTRNIAINFLVKVLWVEGETYRRSPVTLIQAFVPNFFGF